MIMPCIKLSDFDIFLKEENLIQVALDSDFGINIK